MSCLGRLPSTVTRSLPLRSSRSCLTTKLYRPFTTTPPQRGPMTSPILNAVVSAASPSAAPSNAGDRAHHAKSGKGFVNPWPSFVDRSTPSIIWELTSRNWKGEGNKPDTNAHTIPIHKPSFLPTRETPHLRATWLGHACYYVEFPSGLRILFDPVFTDRCSPISFMGPKRYTPVPCKVPDFPFLDAVVISHNHYDHLSHPTIMDIHRQFPNAHFFCPLGNKAWFEASGIPHSTELDWWQSIDLTLSPSKDAKDPSPSSTSVGATKAATTHPINATLQCLPAQHMTARSGADRAQTLWCSWAVTSGGSSVWFTGDTGYRSVTRGAEHDLTRPHCPAFAEIGEHAGPFDLGLIPIGAYAPRFIMSPVHIEPRDSVEIFEQTRCRNALAMHWGTWVLTEEDVMEPPRLLAEALKAKGIDGERFAVCGIGESREFGRGK